MAIESALVTGGAGFIGSHVVRALIRAGAKVRVLDNLSTGTSANLAGLPRGVEFTEGDVRNAVACRAACRGIDAVFHLAAYISVPGSVADPVTADSVNIGGTLNMLLAARDCGARRLVFSSSAAVYGDTDVIPTPETVVPQPLSPYGVEKLYGEHMCRLFAQLDGLEAVALRYFNVFGPRQNPKSEYAAVIPKFITTLLGRGRATVFGDGGQTRDFLFVEDVARANLLAAESSGAGGKVYNIAGGSHVSVCELHALIASAVGTRKTPIHGPDRPGDIRHSSADISQARSDLRFEPSVSLAEGLSRTTAYYRNQFGT